MTRSRNSRRKYPRTYSPAPRRYFLGNSLKPANSWCPSGLSKRLSNKKTLKFCFEFLKKEAVSIVEEKIV